MINCDTELTVSQKQFCNFLFKSQQNGAEFLMNWNFKKKKKKKTVKTKKGLSNDVLSLPYGGDECTHSKQL